MRTTLFLYTSSSTSVLRAWYAYLFYTLLALILIYFIFRSIKRDFYCKILWT